ncbi:hypothetical protein LTR85_000511 [Meristemomyces frigidus]|nr:hypothetical protein LTR85_000511 [Meristemomyces frigidus]
MQLTTFTILGALMFGMMTTVNAAPAAVLEVSDNTTVVPVTPTFSAPAAKSTNGTDGSLKVFQYSEAAQSAHDNVNSMISTDDSSTHIGDDGVARAFAGNGTVIDYRKLSNSQLLSLAASLPPSVQDLQEHLEEVYANVDGNDVTDPKELWDPAAHLRPDAAEADDMPEAQPQSRNPQHDVAAALDSRQSYGIPALYCLGATCSTRAACQFMGCGDCRSSDQAYRRKVCY